MRSTIYSSWAIALSIVSNAIAQTVSSSNSSQDLYPPATSPRFLLNGSEFPDMPAIRLAPLGHYAEMSYSDFTATDVNGQLISITSENVNDDFGGSPRKFFYVSCEPSDYPGNLHANEVFNLAANNENAFLIILYTTRSDHCTATGLDNLRALASVMTTTEPMVAEMLANMNLGPSSPGTATLLPDLNAYTNDTNSGTRSWYGPGRGSNGSPTTAVAMIILYSITGVITALFVTIIITGAIRAHRHPERYGPRVAGIGGRGRQGRARGIARAVVDSLPIVKFGDRDGDSGGAAGGAQKKASVSNSTNDTTGPNETTRDSDIEMTAGLPAISSRNDSPSQPADTTTKCAAVVNTLTATTPTDTTTNLDSPSNPPTGPMPIAGASEENAPSCSICTEDFVLGSDLRVLPCKHRFHPECVDPWLLNVSGTCPLCRIDLRPKDTGESDLDPAGDGNGAAGLEGDAPADRAAGARQGSFSQAGGFRPGEDQIMAFSLRSGRSRGVSNANANRRPSAADGGAESAGALATLRRAMAGSREERVAALRRFREHEQRRAEGDGVGEQAGAAGAGEGSEDVEARRRGLASRLRERLRVRTERRGEGQGEGQAQEQEQEQTLGQIRSREHVGGIPV